MFTVDEQTEKNEISSLVFVLRSIQIYFNIVLVSKRT